MENEELKVTRGDERELPLRKVMKLLKSRGTKGKKEKRKSLPEEPKAEKDLDVLNMVRQINLETMDISRRVESLNGREVRPKKEKKSDINYQNGEKTEGIDGTPSPIPKRRRSSIAHGTATSLKCSNESGDDEFLADSALLVSCSPKASISSSKRSRKRFGRDHVNVPESGEVLDEDVKRSRDFEDSENVDASKVKVMIGSPKKKRKTMSGFAKCTSKEGENLLEDLIGCRIKVWWPMDKQFYEGTVKSYDLSRNRHVVLYDDGDVEILNLEKERWEIVNKGHKFAKKLKLLRANSAKKMSPDKKEKVLPESRGLNDSEEIVKRKRTPKKTSRQKKRGPEETEISVQDKGGFNIANAKMVCSGDDQIEGMEEPHFKEDDDDHTLGGESNENMQPTNEVEGSPNFAVVTGEEEGLSNIDSPPPDAHESEGEEVSPKPPASTEVERSPKKKKIDSCKSKSQGKSKKKSAKSSSTEESEIPDDEPLKLWKKRVGGMSDTTRR